ncbi:TetR-like C-terminal domain-containing protein [Thermoactinospora rubra]|uniref:TetR-like C-terminal domain-containing protein n=1 Tax=Thermoactinospora rubra TaxID=1088767 RepID=UPI003B84A29E
MRGGELRSGLDLPLVVELLYGPLYYRLIIHRDLYSPERLRSLIDHVIGPLRNPEVTRTIR